MSSGSSLENILRSLDVWYFCRFVVCSAVICNILRSDFCFLLALFVFVLSVRFCCICFRSRVFPLGFFFLFFSSFSLGDRPGRGFFFFALLPSLVLRSRIRRCRRELACCALFPPPSSPSLRPPPLPPRRGRPPLLPAVFLSVFLSFLLFLFCFFLFFFLTLSFLVFLFFFLLFLFLLLFFLLFLFLLFIFLRFLLSSLSLASEYGLSWIHVRHMLSDVLPNQMTPCSLLW